MRSRRRVKDAAGYAIVYITAANAEEAERLGMTLVEERLAACANIVPAITSFFRGEGALCRESEALLLVKTTRSAAERVAARVRDLHSYDNPAIVVLQVAGGSKEFLQWIGAAVETAESG